MISKRMNKLLKKIPHSPKTTTLQELSRKKIMDINLLVDLLEDAIGCHYVAYASRNPYNDISKSKICLTEAGQIVIEEYAEQRGASVKATWALVISALSVIASVVAIVVSCVK